MKLTARPYQLVGLQQIRENFAKGFRKVLLHLATGGGKTFIFCMILAGVRAKGKRALMVVRGRELVDQASNRLTREGIDHGVIMAGHWKEDANNPIQVCSVDTLRARQIFPPADLIVIDEVHMATSASYREFLSNYPQSFVLGVTATPYPKEGMGNLADAVVHPISVQELIDQGYLVPPVYYAPNVPDMKGVKVSKGDYNTKESEIKMNTLTGDIVTHWRKFGEDRTTICFAVSLVHSKSIVQAFNEQGINAAHIEAETPDKERKEVMAKLERRELKIVSNVGILCTGVDMPYISCIVMARPTKSYNLFIQQAGRGTRPYDNKSDFLLLDHAGNIIRHGLITCEREALLDAGKGAVAHIPNFKRCYDCFALFSVFAKLCPVCGSNSLAETKPRKINQIDGDLVRLNNEDQLAFEIRSFIMQKKDEARRKGYKKGWVFFQLKEKYGDEAANQYIPKRKFSERQLEIIREKRALSASE